MRKVENVNSDVYLSEAPGTRNSGVAVMSVVRWVHDDAREKVPRRCIMAVLPSRVGRFIRRF